jgi:hypothetical protein
MHQGQVVVRPMTGWELVRIAMTALLRVQYLPNQEAERTGERSHLQLAMTSAQCRMLAEDLLKTADRLDAQPMGTKQ